MKRKMRKFEEGGMTDEERYGKVGAAIRKLDPEAYKNRPRTLEGNLKLLKELRAKAKKPSVNFAVQGRNPTVDFEKEGRVVAKSGTIAAGIEPDDTPSQSMRDKARGEVNRSTNRRDSGPKRDRSILDKVTNFISNTRMVGGAPDYMKDESGRIRTPSRDSGMRHGGHVKKYAKSGSASRRADGIAQRGKTRGKYV